MNLADLMVAPLIQSQEILKMTLSDFSDADMLMRPAPGANHAAWQLGHLTASEAGLINQFQPNAVPMIPGFGDKFSKEAAKSDDPSAFPKKAELLDAFTRTRANTIQWVKSLKPEDLDKTGPENLRRLATNIGQLVGLLPSHTMMHLGQFQVIRRKLGKPVLF